MEKVIMFDFDGVIVDSLEVFQKSFTDSCERLGLEEFAGGVDFLELFETNFYEALAAAGFPPERMRELNRGMEEELTKANRRLQMFAGAGAMLQKLAHEHTVVIITSSITSVVEGYLRAQNINGVKEVVGAEKEASKVKKIRRTMAKFPQGTYYYIGDTKGDMVEGKKAGATTVAVTWGWHSRERLRKGEPDFMVNTPEELVRLFADERD